MKQEVLKQFDLPWMPIVGLIIFVLCFICYIFFTYRKSNRSFYEEASLIPLQDSNISKNSFKGGH
jgi:cbb3-type cytochrome oxidase subunit 3